MHSKTIKELQQGLAKKEFSSVELCQHYLKRAQSLGKKLNAFITLDDEAVLAHAKKADEKRAQGTQDPLLGIPIAQKDIFCTQGVKTSCGSKMLDNFVAPYNATAIEKFNHSGAILFGKTNMDEFAMGSSTEHSFYGPAHNPWDLKTTPGGSSGGSAAVVSARLCPGATGTDTGGSIRQPAALCGITGIKPTYGRVSRYGMVAFASSLDQGGVFTQTAEDAAILLNVMCGHDPKDSTSSELAVPNFTASINHSLQGLKIGLPKQFFNAQLNAEMTKALSTAQNELKQAGAKLIEIDLPHLDLSLPVYYVIAPAEASSNLARYDGVRYGYRCKDPVDLEDLYTRTRTEGFGDEVKRRIMIGTYVLSAGFYDAFYLKAQKIRRLIKNDFLNAFKQVDVILGPTAPNVAFELGSVTDPVTMYLNDVYTIGVSLAGLPALSIPVGFMNHMPIGMQLIGNYFDEARILNVAHQYQLRTDWHKQAPNDYK